MPVLTEEQRLLRDTVRALADERIAPRAAEIDRAAEFPWDVKELLAEHELFCPATSRSTSAVWAATCSRPASRSSRSAGPARRRGSSSPSRSWAALPILLAGTDEQQRRWIPDLAAGKTLIAFAITEAEAGSDARPSGRGRRATATTTSSTGSKRFISHGSVADLVTVFAVTDPDGERHRRLSCFVVETDRPGFSVARLEHKMGIRGSPTAELAFDGRPGPGATTSSAPRATGSRIAMKTFDRSRPGIAAQAVGIAQGALEVATRYARERQPVRPSGRPTSRWSRRCWPTWTRRTESARQLLYTACRRSRPATRDVGALGLAGQAGRRRRGDAR